MVVSDGLLSLPGAMLGHNADPAARAAWLEDMFLPPDVLEWALNVVVVRSGGRTILIDVGIGTEFPDLKRAGKLAQRLKAAGIDPASVTDVVLTHMHMDHCGGLLADGVRDRLRPDLRVHVAAAEAKFWESPDFSRVSMPPGSMTSIPSRFSDPSAALRMVSGWLLRPVFALVAGSIAKPNLVAIVTWSRTLRKASPTISSLVKGP